MAPASLGRGQDAHVFQEICNLGRMTRASARLEVEGLLAFLAFPVSQGMQ